MKLLTKMWLQKKSSLIAIIFFLAILSVVLIMFVKIELPRYLQTESGISVTAGIGESSQAGSSGWWNSSFSKRKEIQINNSATFGNLTDYQVLFNVTYDSDMSSIFKDIRFTYYNSTSGTETELSYWVERNISSSYADVWVKVPFISNKTNETVYMYYGSSSADTASNGVNTFIFFDDFNDNSYNGTKWGMYNYSTGTSDTFETNQRVENHIYGGGLEQYHYGKTGYAYEGRRIKTSFNPFNMSNSRDNLLSWTWATTGLQTALARALQVWWWTSVNSVQFSCNPSNGGALTSVDLSTNLRTNTWYITEILNNGTTAYARVVNQTNYTPVGNASLSCYSYSAATLYPSFGMYYIGSNYWDWIFASKYVGPEPTYSFRSEETSLHWQNNIVNSTSGGPTLFSVNWTDNVALNNSGGYIFSFDNGTGTFVNDSFIRWGEIPQNSTEWANSLMSLWHMNGDASSALGGDPGTLSGDVSCSVEGRFGKACNFDGNLDYITVPHKNYFSGDNNLTISFWTKPANDAEYEYNLYKCYSGATADYTLGVDNTRAAFDMYNTTPALNSVSYTGSFANQWVFITAVHNHQTEEMLLYVNGTLRASGTFTGTHRSGSAALGIGGVCAGGYAEDYYMNAVMDDLAIWDRVLSAEEISTLYNMSKDFPTQSWSNVTKIVSPTGVKRWQVFANDSSNVWNSTDIFSFDSAPQWRNQGTNDTDNQIASGGGIILASQGYDENNLDVAWIATNETGQWKNYTENTKVGPSWWNSSWTKRKEVQINNSATQNLTNYQVLFNITYDSDMNSIFKDLRFTYYNYTTQNETEIPYWVENNASSSYADVWVNVSFISNSTNTTMYIYYGNPNANSTSNGNNTFPFFDDFSGTTYDTSRWTLVSPGSGTTTVANGEVTIKSDGSTYEGIKSTSTFTAPFSFRSRSKLNDYRNLLFGMHTSGQTDPTTQINMISLFLTGSSPTQYTNDADGSASDQDAVSWPAASYHTWEILTNSTGHHNFKINGTTVDNDGAKAYTSAERLWIIAYYLSSTNGIVTDWVLIRNYTSSEPTYSIGSEESYATRNYTYPINMFDVGATWVWSNFTWTNSSVSSGTIGWRIYYNDTSGNVNTTDILTFTISGGACTPPGSGDWNITTQCDITTSVTVSGNINVNNGGILNITGTGNVSFAGANRYIYVYSGGNISIYSGGAINK